MSVYAWWWHGSHVIQNNSIFDSSIWRTDGSGNVVSVCDFCKCSDSGVKISESYKWGLYLAGLGVIKSVCEIISNYTFNWVNLAGGNYFFIHSQLVLNKKMLIKCVEKQERLFVHLGLLLSKIKFWFKPSKHPMLW